MPTDEMFPTQITPQEQTAGFRLTQIKNPKGHYFLQPAQVDAVVRDLGGGKIAVKMSGITGGAEYAIWNAQQRPVDNATSSLAALLTRYPVRL